MLRFIRMNFRNRTPPSAKVDRKAGRVAPSCQLADSKSLASVGVFCFISSRICSAFYMKTMPTAPMVLPD